MPNPFPWYSAGTLLAIASASPGNSVLSHCECARECGRNECANKRFIQVVGPNGLRRNVT